MANSFPIFELEKINAYAFFAYLLCISDQVCMCVCACVCVHALNLLSIIAEWLVNQPGDQSDPAALPLNLTLVLLTQPVGTWF